MTHEFECSTSHPADYVDLSRSIAHAQLDRLSELGNTHHIPVSKSLEPFEGELTLCVTL